MSDREMTVAETRAVRRVEKAIKALAESVGLYFHGSDATVLACNEDGYMIRSGEGFDRDAILGGIETPRCEAGSW